MYFKGLWQSKFLRENTKKEVFFMSPARKTLVPMMRQNGNFKYRTFNFNYYFNKNVVHKIFKLW